MLLKVKQNWECWFGMDDGSGWYAGDEPASYVMMIRGDCWFDEEAGVGCWRLVCRLKVL